MSKEVLSSLNLKEGDVVVDATVGGAGHSRDILKAILPGGRLIGIDADEEALKIGAERLRDYDGSFTLINDNFRNIDAVLNRENIKCVDAVLFDIGISSYQIEDPSRGFSIKHDSRLDMRMDRRIRVSAYEVINRYSEHDLSDIIAEYGQERFHKRIAHAIIEARRIAPIETTGRLSGIIKSVVGYMYRKQKIDPATRTFQALRIEVNDELGSLEEGLKKAVFSLKPAGRIAVISFHSLEDRIAKNLFKGYSSLKVLKIITKKPMVPSREEIIVNPRSRSAKLRVAERI